MHYFLTGVITSMWPLSTVKTGRLSQYLHDRFYNELDSSVHYLHILKSLYLLYLILNGKQDFDS